ncbi:hypothetical protein ACQEU5_01990 [Marinactinospora thermotolerans]|uniref:Ogr/Delta-like zinc finger n=1 Tax=Marinactinospora thermotolerans DSM 45154 TaxID=1122192 RepID=A0A1T4M2V3_9ACTN|nr:hypothetical protein [Marinactinospora thermotolerans]SJZ61108.1 hypothetical protein SAMN02745673_00912 [Marinactinospora thermotolerans DSM 45154]
MTSERCAACGRESVDARVESAHYTSEGIVRYRQCACGRRWVDVARFAVVAGHDGLPWSGPN